MSSIIQELQIEATETKNSVSDLLRKAKIVAIKLDLKEFGEWIDKELNGYGGGHKKDFPKYRIVRGEPKAWNLFHGWQPIGFTDAKVGDSMRERVVTQAIGELDDLAKNDSGTFMIDYNTEAANSIRKSIGFDTDVKFMLSRVGVIGILDAVRNSILDWALRLEKAGVKGEGISFSKEDRERAKKAGDTYSIGHIENFAGALGPVSDNATVKVYQINNESKEELKKLIEQIEKYIPEIELTEEKKKEVTKMNLVVKEEIDKKEPQQSKIKSALYSLKSIFEGAAGSIIAQGIIVEISKFLH
ncbi:MAG: hypothetical protein HYW89_04180 [Candidatus Sungiibacteriota bacterium]|uniref:AbiTii domain-containing protein n=1 Tax=Candidatus Sungiibacteriota bacterium TaxID=2750080 RepID=A0A7T5RJB8_9BACT|nr:MAG: hypothetical protein HYW89_04180 [Candidatus Sungbacteria bacterium]